MGRIGAMPVPSARKTVSASGARSSAKVPQGPVKRTVAPGRRSKRWRDPGPPGTRFSSSSRRSPCSGSEAIEYGRVSVSPSTGSRHEMNWPGRKASGAPSRRKSERVSAPWSTIVSSRPTSSGAAMRRDLIDGEARNDDDDDLRVVVLDHRLAAESRRGRQADRLVEQVVLGVVGRREPVEPLAHDHVAGRARAVAAAGVLERDPVRQQHVEDRSGTAVVLEGGLLRVELDHALGIAVLEQDADARHLPALLAAGGRWSERSRWV